VKQCVVSLPHNNSIGNVATAYVKSCSKRIQRSESGSGRTNFAIAMLLLAYLSAGFAALAEKSKPIEPVFQNGTANVAWRLFDNRMTACSARLRLN
jgi:hypothetical protein